MDTLELEIKNLVAEASNFPVASIGDGATLVDDLDFDSIELLELAVQIEEVVGVEIPDSTIRGNMTVGELVEAVRRIRGEK